MNVDDIKSRLQKPVAFTIAALIVFVPLFLYAGAIAAFIAVVALAVFLGPAMSRNLVPLAIIIAVFTLANRLIDINLVEKSVTPTVAAAQTEEATKKAVAGAIANERARVALETREKSLADRERAVAVSTEELNRAQLSVAHEAGVLQKREYALEVRARELAAIKASPPEKQVVYVDREVPVEKTVYVDRPVATPRPSAPTVIAAARAQTAHERDAELVAANQSHMVDRDTSYKRDNCVRTQITASTNATDRVTIRAGCIRAFP